MDGETTMTMHQQTVQGNCLCGAVGYEITGNLGIFQYCHCSRCRKFTGSAFAANLFVLPNQFAWRHGQESVGTYALPNTRHFATAFCKCCGSSLPWQPQSGKIMVIPAGTLEGHPGVEPGKNIFFASRACWFRDPGELPAFDELPEK